MLTLTISDDDEDEAEVADGRQYILISDDDDLQWRIVVLFLSQSNQLSRITVF